MPTHLNHSHLFALPSVMRNLLIISYTIIFLFILNDVKGQQTAQYTMSSSLNKLSFNSAYAGLTNSLDINAVYRQQWAGLSGSPQSQNVNISLPIHVIKSGFGINIDNGMIGAERMTSVKMVYNYWISIGETSTLSIGAAGGIIQKTLDGSKIRTPDGNYTSVPNSLNHNDDLIPISKVSASAPTFDFGIYFKTPVFEIGGAIKNVSKTKISLDDELISFDYALNRNYFFNFAAELDVFGNISILPSVLLKSNLVENQLDLSLLLRYNDNIFLGTAFRGYNTSSIDAMSLIGGVKLNDKITFAYSYDITLSNLNTVSRGSHEVMINYNLNKEIGGGVPPAIIYNPRFL